MPAETGGNDTGGATRTAEAESGAGAEAAGTSVAPNPSGTSEAVQSMLQQAPEVQVWAAGSLAGTEDAASVASGRDTNPTTTVGGTAAQRATSGPAKGKAEPGSSSREQLTAARADLQQEARKLSRELRDEAKIQLEGVMSEAKRAVALASARVAELQAAVRALVVVHDV